MTTRIPTYRDYLGTLSVNLDVAFRNVKRAMEKDMNTAELNYPDILEFEAQVIAFDKLIVNVLRKA